MSKAMTQPRVSLKNAKRIVMFMFVGSMFLAFVRTFTDQDLRGAMLSITSAPLFYWFYRNPELLMARDFDEFCKLYDKATHMQFLKGFPFLYAVLVAAVVYIKLS